MEHSPIATAPAALSHADFCCEAKALQTAVKFLARHVVEPRNTVPIFSCIMIEARPDDSAMLSAYDGRTLAASIVVPAAVEAPGSFCVDGYALRDILAKLAKGSPEMHITDGDARAEIGTGRNRIKLARLPSDDFPMLRAPADAARFDMPAAQLAQDMAALALTMSKEETRYYLRGVAMQRREMAGRERLLFVATDGHTVAAASRAVPAGAEEMADCIIPAAMVGAIAAAAKAYPIGETAGASVGERMAAVELGAVTLIAELIDGTFPQWERLFDEQLAAGEAEPALFPELLPGLPVVAMEKLAKAAGDIDWQPARQGLVGGLASDPDMLFAAYRKPGGECSKQGFDYRATGATGEVEGPDGVTYPIAFSDSAIHLSAAQLRALIGESCFETMEVPGQPFCYILQWLWEQGDSRFLIVGPDGRVKGEGRNYVTRAEIEAAMAVETVDLPADEPIAVEMAAVSILAAPQSVSAAPAPEVPLSEIGAEEPLAALADVAALMARLDAVEDALASRPAEVERVTFRPSVVAVEIAMPPIAVARPKRTPAHERAIRRAWAERAARRTAERVAQLRQEQRRNALRFAGKWRTKAEAAAIKASGWERRIEAEREAAGAIADKRRRTVTTARQALSRARKVASNHRQHASALSAELARIKRDMADASQPERASDISRLMTERDQARNALAAMTARAARSEAAVGQLADTIDSLASRVSVAEAKLRKAA